MILRDDLRTWASDKTRQKQTRLAADRFVGAWSEGAAHRAFIDTMARLPQESPEAVVDAVRALFDDTSWLDDLVGRVAAEMARDPFFEAPFTHHKGDLHTGMIVFEGDKVRVSVGVTRVAQLAARKNGKRGALSIGFSGQVSLLKFLKAGGAILSFWEAPEITGDFAAATAGQCRPAGKLALADGDTVLVDGRRQGFVIEHAAANLCILQATVKTGQAPLTVEYDAHTHGYVGCSAADDRSSRIQMMATLVRKLDGKAGFDAIAANLDHPDFFVRWHVMRELIGIDFKAALPHLKRMAAGDAHADVRRTARALLDRLEGGSPKKEAA